MVKEPPQHSPPDGDRLRVVRGVLEERLPLPTAHFRVRAWHEFQRAIDPLAVPRPPRLRKI